MPRDGGRQRRWASSPHLEGLEDRRLLSLSFPSDSAAARVSPGWFQRLSPPAATAGDDQPLESRIERIGGAFPLCSLTARTRTTKGRKR